MNSKEILHQLRNGDLDIHEVIEALIFYELDKKEEEINHEAFDFGWNNWWEDDTRVCYLDEEFVRDVENYLEKN